MPEQLSTRIAAFRQATGAALFPQAPTGGRRFGRGEATLLVVALLALAVILQLFRVGVENALESIWAEDGPILLQTSLGDAFLDALRTPYAGYLIFVPRLIGEVGAAVPLRDAAAAIAISSALVVALCGLVIWFASAGQVRNPYLRGALVALTVLSPVAALESIVAGSYVLWYMLFASFWVLIWRPASMRGAILGGLFVLATGLSTPGLWFFAPAAALRLLAARDRRDLTILAGYAIGAAVQVPILATNSEAAAEPEWSADIWTSYLQRVLDGGVFGESLGGVAWEQFGWALLIALIVATVVGLLWVAWRSSAPVRAFVALAVGTSVVMFVASAYQRAVGTPMMWPPDLHFGNAGRYAVVPALLLASAALVAIDRWPRRLPGPAQLPWAGALAVLLAAVAIATSFAVAETEVRGTPRWDVALEQSLPGCGAEDATDVAVPISPPGFGLYISCQRLSDAVGDR